MSINMFKGSDKTESFAAGATIFSEGDSPDGMMYVVVDGEVDIFANGKHIDTVGPGASLGEIGLVDNGPRTATAVAKVPCRLEPINARRFELLVQQTPYFALEIMKTLVQRIRQHRGH